MPFFAITKAMIARPTPTITADQAPGMPALASAATKSRGQDVQRRDRDHGRRENAACRDHRLGGLVAHLRAKELDLLSEQLRHLVQQVRHQAGRGPFLRISHDLTLRRTRPTTRSGRTWLRRGLASKRLEEASVARRRRGTGEPREGEADQRSTSQVRHRVLAAKLRELARHRADALPLDGVRDLLQAVRGLAKQILLKRASLPSLRRPPRDPRPFGRSRPAACSLVSSTFSVAADFASSRLESAASRRSPSRSCAAAPASRAVWTRSLSAALSCSRLRSSARLSRSRRSPSEMPGARPAPRQHSGQGPSRRRRWIGIAEMRFATGPTTQVEP